MVDARPIFDVIIFLHFIRRFLQNRMKYASRIPAKIHRKSGRSQEMSGKLHRTETLAHHLQQAALE